MTTDFHRFIAEQDLILVKAIRDNAKTKGDIDTLTQLEKEEGASLEYFSFPSLLSIYTDLIKGDLTA